MEYTEIVNKIVKQIIEWSTDNTAGLVMSKKNIRKTVNICIGNMNLSRNFIDVTMEQNESDRGYLVKTDDISSAIYPYKDDLSED